jgi:tetratricopeptide (TPR) repeat protein
MNSARSVLCFVCGFSVFFSFSTAQISYSDNYQLSNLMPQDAFKKGVDFFLSKDLSEAENVFRYCIEQEPGNAEYTCWLAQTLAFVLAERAKKGASSLSMLPDGRKVKNLYYKAMELDPTCERARIGQAVILRDIPGWLGGSVKKAEAIFIDLLKKNPKSLSGMHFLGTLYTKKQKKYEKGIEILLEAIALSKTMELTEEQKLKMARTYHAVGKTYLDHLDQAEKSISYFEQSLVFDPISPVTFLDLIEACRETEHIAEAKENLHKVADLIHQHNYKRYNKDLAKAARKLKVKKKDVGL